NDSGSTFGRVSFNGTQTLGGSASVVFGGSGSNFLGASGGQTLTLGPSISVQGRNGRLGNTDSTLVNQNTITVNVAAANFFVSGVRNSGTIQAQNGASLTLDGTWSNSNTISISGGTLSLAGSFSNSGTISATNATVNLDATFTLADLGTFNRTGGTV